MSNIIKNVINVGSQSNDGTGDSIRDAFSKVNSNFDTLYAVAGIGNGLQFTSLQDAPTTLQSQKIMVTDSGGLTLTQMTVVGREGIQITYDYANGQLIVDSTVTSLISDSTPTIQAGANLSGATTARAILFADPKRDTDLVTKQWVENNFLNRDGNFESDSGVSPNQSTATIVEGSTLRHNIVLNPTAVQTLTNVAKVISTINASGITATINLAYQAWKNEHVTRKDYVDTKISLQGISTVDSLTGEVNPGFGQMTGGLQLFRDPVETDSPLTAATKNYVDSTGFPSKSNFFVALNGNDNRTDIPTFKRGRSWAWAFRSINKAAQAAEAFQNSSQIVLGPYVKTITTNNFSNPVQIIQITGSTIPDAQKLVVNYDGTAGTDPFINSSIYPGIYIIGQDTGATAEILNVVNGGVGTEYYEVVPVDYAPGIPSSIVASAATGTITVNLTAQNLVGIPEFWIDYTIKLDDSVGGGQGTIIGSDVYYDATGNVFDRLIVQVTKPFGQHGIAIPNANWHVYAGDWTDPTNNTAGFSVGETLRYGQGYNRTEVSIKVESGEYDEDFPIRLADNVSIVGDEFRRSMVRPGKWPETQRPLRSTSPYANLYFRRDTQVDGLIITEINTATNYAASVAVTPDGVTNSALTGVINFTVNQGTANTTWVNKVFSGAGGKGVITAVNGSVFSVNIAENSQGVRSISTSSTISTGSWAIYAPINFGYHYLKDPTRPMNLLGWEPGGALSNPGGYNVASATLLKNKQFIQEEVIQFLDATYPPGTFVYNRAKYKRDVAYFVEGLAYDLQTGSVSRTINLPEAYFVSSETYVYQNELPQLTAAITYIGTLASQVMSNTTGTRYQSTVTQVFADVSLELDASTKVTELVATINTILNNSDPTYNPGKFNNELDIFLMNDATMIRYLAGQGHGGFMKVLDPYGQIKAKSPYTQTASSFSESIGRHRFAGGFFVDGYTGNMLLDTTQSIASQNGLGDYVAIPVRGYALTLRTPLTPCFFVYNGIQYQVDYVSDWNPSANANYGTATLNLDPNKPGGIQGVTMNGTLTGFKGSQAQIPVTISSPGTAGGLTARGYVTTDISGVIQSMTITYPGTGYVRSTDPGYDSNKNAITFVLGGATFNMTIVGRVIKTLTVSNPGAGYTTNTPINIAAPNSGSQATASITAVDANGGIVSVNLSSGGSGYTTTPKITFGNSNITYSTVIKKGFIGTLPSSIETVTAGNRSMLANDFTQINDYAYGIFATNGGFIENVSMFSYYCWTSYYALNGAQLRTITGSSAYGTYGLIAEGSDPTEIPIAISMPDELQQVVTIYNQAPYSNLAAGTTIYASIAGAISFIPMDDSDLEINHSGTRKTYRIKTTTFTTTASGGLYVYALSLDSSISSSGLYAAVPDGTTAIMRSKSQFRLSGVNAKTLTRPSTVLSLYEDPTNVYRILSYTDQGNDVALAEADQSYDYITLQPYQINNLYRQGVTRPLISSAGSNYSGSTATITFGTPSPFTITAAVNGNQGTASVPVTTFLITGAGSTIHPGMSVSGTGVLPATYVTWCSSDLSTISVNQSQYLTGGVTLTFTAVTATGYATVSGGAVNGVVITDPGVGYNSVPSVTAATPGGGTSATITVSLAGVVGSSYVKVLDVGAQSLARFQIDASDTTYNYRFGYDGRIYNITAYTPPSTTVPWGELTIGAYSTGTGLTSEITIDPLYAGVAANSTGSITVRISTLRATSHDMVDVGTGGYSTTKIPNDLYGPPLISPNQAQEVIEKSKGRVYYVTTDQDGNFRVGKYFHVDQGRGTVTINAPISLSGVESLGFKKGVTVNEFSIDANMAAESTSKVPTEQAIVNYVNARLGISKTGALWPTNIGPGFLPLSGSSSGGGLPQMAGAINMNQNFIYNLPVPTQPSYAANKAYADTKISLAGMNEAQINGGQLAGQMTGPLELVGNPNVTTGVTTQIANVSNTLLYVNTSTLYLGMQINSPAASTGTYINSIGNGYVGLSAALIGTIASGSTVTFDPIYQGATKQYVDSSAQISKLRDVTLTSPTNQDLLMFTSQAVAQVNQTVPFYNTATTLVNVSNNNATITNTSSASSGGSDVSFSRSGNTLTIKLNGGTVSSANNPITDYHVNAAAQIAQSKLLMTVASASASSPTGTQQQIQANLGLSQYNIGVFTTTNGWVNLATATSTSNGIPTTALRWITGASTGGLLGSVAAGNADAAVTSLSSSTVRSWLNVGSLAAGGTFSGAVTFTGGVTVTTTDIDVQSNLYTHNIYADASNTYNIGSTSTYYKTMYLDTLYVKTGIGGSGAYLYSIPNAALVNNAVTVSAGTGMTGGGSVALGGTITLTNNGVVGLTNGTGISITGTAGGSFTINASGVPNSALSNSSITVSAGTGMSGGGTPALGGTVTLTNNGVVGLTNGGHITATGTAGGTFTLGSDATDANTANTIVSRDGSGNFSAGVMSGTATAARYADLAERYTSDVIYEPGTVLIFGGDKEVTESTSANDKRVAGVVSTNPGYMMNSELEGGLYVALTGRVPCRVVGTIKKGDLMVTSHIPGVAMANDDPKIGTVIGKALEDYDSPEVGVIEVVVGRV
jgi:hypothetical protein